VLGLPVGALRVKRVVWRWRDGRPLFVTVVAVALATAACSRSGSSTQQTSSDNRISPKTGTSASQRVFVDGQQIPKGGGTYKIGSPYKIGTRWYTPTEDPNYDRRGLGSWYGSDFHGRKTANGEIFDMNALTAAHPTLPIPSYAYVTNLSNNRTVLVRINDRGPYAHDRIIDLSRRSARELGFEQNGVTQVRVKYAGRAPLDGSDHHERTFTARMQGGGALAQDQPPVSQRSAETAYRPTEAPVAASQLPSGLTWRR
jgi:rare lipoprotein A